MEALPPLLRVASATAFYVAAYATGIALFVWLARRRSVDVADLRTMIFAGLAGGASGAALVQSAAGGTGGRTILGGVAGGWLAVIAAKRALAFRRPLGDYFAVALAGGEAVGRIGCFFYGCCYGKVAHVAWAVNDHGAPRHPTQLYSSAWSALTLAVLVALERRRPLPDGGLFFVQGALLCLGRFAIEGFREPGAVAGPLTVAQWACIAGFGFFAWRLRLLLRAPAEVAA